MFKFLLYPASWLYKMAVLFRHQLFDWGILHSEKFDIPVICIGNITVGGTGKMCIRDRRRGVDGFQYAVVQRAGDRAFALGVTAPEHVDDPRFALGDGTDDGIGAGFPPASGAVSYTHLDVYKRQRSRWPISTWSATIT